jgi:hypothetical protein
VVLLVNSNGSQAMGRVFPAFRYISPLLWISMAAIMTFEEQYRVSVIPLLLAAGFLELAQSRGINLYSYSMATRLLILLKVFLLAVSAIKVIIFNLDISSIIYFFLPPYTILILSMALVRIPPMEFLRVFCVGALSIALVLLAFYVAGVDMVASDNSIAALFFIGILYPAARRRMRMQIVLSVVAVIVAWYVNARLVMLMPVILLVFNMWRGSAILKILSPLIIVAVAGGSIFFTFNFNRELNDILTNRVIIWNLYGDRIEDRPLSGHAGIEESVAEEIADDVGLYARRGVNSAYGTQNLFVRYAYEDGLVAVSAIALIILGVAWRSPRVRPAVIALLPACALESLKIGVPSLWGIPLLLVILMAAQDGRTGKNRRARWCQPW